MESQYLEPDFTAWYNGGNPTLATLTLSGLTANRVPVVTTGGLITDSVSLTFIPAGSLIIGSNSVTGAQGLTAGYHNVVSSNFSFVFGTNLTVATEQSFTFGFDSVDFQLTSGLAAFEDTNIITSGTLGAGAITGTSFKIGTNTISDFGDLKAIEELSGTSGFAKKTAANTWSLAAMTSYVDRGDPNAWDYVVGDFTRDNVWHELDLSAIVPAGATAVLVRVAVESSPAPKYFNLRKNGNANVFNITTLATQVAGIPFRDTFIVSVDAERIIEYLVTDTTVTTINFVIRGWFA